MARKSLSKLETPWEEYYDISLRVYEATVEAELCLGNFEVGMAAGKILLGQAMSLDDKLPTYLAICRSFARRELHKEAYEMSMEILRTLGAFPKGGLGVKMRVIKDVVFVKRFLARHSDAEILALPVLTDKRVKAILELFSVAGLNAYFCGAAMDHLAIVFRGLVVSLTKGLSPASGVNLMGSCLICNALDDMKSAHRFLNLAQEILDLTNAKEETCL